MAYMKHILCTTSCSTFILQDNGTEFKNSHILASFKSLAIKPISSNLYRPQGNSRLENAHNFLKCTISKFLHSNMLEWDDILPIAAYIYNIAPTVNDLKSPFFLVFGRDPFEGRLSHLQNYCRLPQDRTRAVSSRQTQKYVETACRITLGYQRGQRS